MEKNKDNLITLVIHTRPRAHRLKEVLEAHGIEVVLEDITFEVSDIQYSPQRVKINIDSLSLALKILESGDLVSSPLEIPRLDSAGNTLLIPVDFSASSMLAVKVGFYLAKKLSLEPMVLHAFLTPQISAGQFYENQIDPVGVPEVSEIEEEIDIQNIASSQLSKFKKKIENAIREGEIEDIKFSTNLIQGVAEQVILEYCRQNNPLLMVMTTRNVAQKESDLIGSVTAEVIDSCRIPVVTVPDNYRPHGVEKIKKIAMFCTFTSYDAVIIRGLMRMFNYPSCEIWLIPANESHSSDNKQRLDTLKHYLSDTFPTASFQSYTYEKNKFDCDIRQLIDEKHIDMIFIPNKKSNAFSRFFHPTLAHKMLFERDIPLLIIPV